MQFMVTWRLPAASYRAALVRFLETGAPPSEGLKTLGRWHAAGSTKGFHLLEGTEAALMQHIAEWADLMDIEAFPDVDDQTAGAIATRLVQKT